MEANELRIGNKVYHTHFFIRTISSIRTNSTDVPLVRFANSGGEYAIDKINPIPLTEQMLLKCGFEKQKKCWLFDNEIGRYHLNSKKFISGFNGKLVKCEFLHQLQNLYFALTGQELTIEL